LWIADCGLKIEVLKPQSEIPLTKISVFPAAASLQTGFPLRSNTFQLLCFFFLTPESLTPETSNSEICNPKSPPSLARFVLILSATLMMKYPG
jgi:hypothetical protein